MSKSGKLFLLIAVLLALAGAGVWRYSRTSNQPGQITVAKANGEEFISVQTILPERKEISRLVSLSASLEAFEQTTLYAKAAGYLKWIKVDIGDSVKAGDVIAEISVPEMGNDYEAAEVEVERAKANIANIEAELDRANAELELKKITYDRLKSIREQEPDVMPQQQVDEAKGQFDIARAMVTLAKSKIKVARTEVAKAEAAQSRIVTLMQYAKIRAPFNGIVVKRFVDPGAMIQMASSQMNISPIVTVAKVDTLRVFIDATELDVPFVKKGNQVAVTVNALPGKVFQGTCTRFATALDPKSRTMRTEIDIPNPDGQLRPGMYGEVKLALERHENALLVPASALIVEKDKTYLFAVVDGKAKRVEVHTGLDDGIHVEITSGISDTDQIITTGKSAVKDGVMVKASQASS